MVDTVVASCPASLSLCLARTAISSLFQDRVALRQPGLDHKQHWQYCLRRCQASIFVSASCTAINHNMSIYLSQTTIHAMDTESCRPPFKTTSRNVKIEIVADQVPHIALRPIRQEPAVPDRYDCFCPAAWSRQKAHPKHAILGQHCLDRSPIAEWSQVSDP